MDTVSVNDYKLRWGQKHSELFSDLIERLNQNKVRYFILRNYEQLPQGNPSKDVDIIIEPGAYRKAAEILKCVYEKYGFSYVSITQYERVRCWYGACTGGGESIHIDLIEGYLHKGFEVFPFDLLYRNTRSYGAFRVLNDDYDTVILLYYKILAAKSLLERYRERIQQGYSSCGSIDHIIRNTCGRKLGNSIIRCLQKRDYDAIARMTLKISIATKIHAFLHKPLGTMRQVAAFCFWKFYRIIICPAQFRKFIAVLGPDGVGKSTFIDELVKRIGFYYVSDQSKSRVYHHRPNILPNLGALGEKAKIMKEDKDFSNPHRERPANRFSSFVRMSYYWLDYVIGVPVIIRKNVKYDLFTINDRYIYDFLIDPLRSRIKLPYWIRRFFSVIVPQPGLVFILSTDAETIYNRKPELSRDEIKRQLGEYQKLARHSRRFVILDASQRPEQLADQAAEMILQRFASLNLKKG